MVKLIQALNDFNLVNLKKTKTLLLRYCSQGS